MPGLNKRGHPHPNFKLPYLQDYLRRYGVRKCEANAIVTTPDAARQLVRDAIESIIGDARARFAAKREAVQSRYAELLAETKLARPLSAVIRSADEDDDM